MATIQNLLTDIRLLYRNTFTDAQILVWMNDEQRELFETLEVDSVPFSFPLVDGNFLYPIPDGVEKNRIKVVTIQVNDVDYIELPFVENDDNKSSNVSAYWYTILENNMYINTPGEAIDGRYVMIYCDVQPQDMIVSNLNVEPSVPVRYQELLKLGTLKRIAAARKDTEMKNNYEAEYEKKILDLEWKMLVQQPEFYSPSDMLPRRSRYRSNRMVEFVTLRTDNNGTNTWQELANNQWISLD